MPTTRNKRGTRPKSKTASRSKAGAGRAGTRSKARSQGSDLTCGDVMTPDPVTLIESETLANAARIMREQDIGDVIVLDDTSARLKGIVTDRDMVVRGMAEDLDPAQTTLASIVSEGLVCCSPTDSVDKAVEFMREKAIRRIPVVEDDRPVGIVSMGDLAVELDRRSALADVSAAPPNN